jgi:hypothetical protein
MNKDDECPNCKSGTLERNENDLICRGECGAAFPDVLGQAEADEAVKLVEGTLPRLARAIEKLADALDLEDVEWEIAYSDTSPGPGWEPFQVTNTRPTYDGVRPAGIVWKRRKQ